MFLTFMNHYFKDGEPRDDYNFRVYLIDFLITLGLLYWGGFFDVILTKL